MVCSPAKQKAIRKCQHNSAMKHIRALRKIIRIALANDYIRKDPFLRYTITIKPVDRGYLTEDELTKLKEEIISMPRIEQVRDAFIFQCYTGLAYCDIHALTKDNLVIAKDGQEWLHFKRGKTKVAVRIPMLTIAMEIIRK